MSEENGSGDSASSSASHPAIDGDQPHRDRRASQRVPIQMWVEELTDGNQVFRRAGNLSIGGLFLDKTIPIPIGTVVKLRFTLPGDQAPVTVEAKIVSIEPEKELGMGCQFVNLDDSIHKRIDEFVKAL